MRKPAAASTAPFFLTLPPLPLGFPAVERVAPTPVEFAHSLLLLSCSGGTASDLKVMSAHCGSLSPSTLSWSITLAGEGEEGRGKREEGRGKRRGG
jgi:hypothetical protein